MSDPTDISGKVPADDAAEFALRLNDALVDVAQAERVEADPAFRAQVEAWDERLAPLFDEIEPVEPPLTVWPRVADSIRPRAANDDTAMRFWRRWAIASTALLAASAAGLAFVLANPRIERHYVSPTPDFQPVSVATLMSADDADMPVATITYDPQTGSLYVAPTMQMAPGEDQAPTLWLMTPEGGMHRVGGIDPSHAQTHSVPMEMRPMAADAPALAVSLEPVDNPDSPTPLGPVVASGEVARL
ncbi:MAG: anti-sigma factor [Caulobacterales bacterium]|nr:anti-sigma factor [Caulobacterales bacterium]